MIWPPFSWPRSFLTAYGVLSNNPRMTAHKQKSLYGIQEKIFSSIKPFLNFLKIMKQRLITSVIQMHCSTNLYTNTVLDGSVILFIRYRNHFPVVQFQNPAHIRNHHGTGQVFKIIWGAAGTPKKIFFYRRRPEWGAQGTPNIFFLLLPPPKAAVSQVGTGGTLKAPLPQRAKEITPKAGVSRVYIYMYI